MSVLHEEVPEDQAVSQQSGKPRVSVACIQCRGRHVRCDAAMPLCSRCRTLGIECTYLKSRRGGRREKGRPNTSAGLVRGSTSPSAPALPSTFSSTSGSNSSNISSPHQIQLLDSNRLDDVINRGCSSTGSNQVPGLISNRSASSGSPSSGESLLNDSYLSGGESVSSRESLLELYYAYFHNAHPCVLPARFLTAILDDTVPSMALLVQVMRFIGSLYSPKQASAPLEAKLKLTMIHCQEQEDGFVVQALVLYSIAVYWCDDKPRSRELLDLAIAKAVRLGMNKREFANDNCKGRPVLAECWRRTWWQLYVTDAHIAASDHAVTFGSSQRNVLCTVELPCEDSDYYSGCIPRLRTLEEYDNREFFDEDIEFSSFAYQIGLIRSLDHIIIGLPRNSEQDVKDMCSKGDAAVAAWVSLLNKSKRRLFNEDRILDEHLFQTNLMVQVYLVDMHRRLSTCAFHPIEAVSSCAPPPPPERLPPVYYRDAPMHTAKILDAVERLTNMLTLPTTMAKHTPFAICMIASTTIGHLSACKYVLRDKQMKVARERIRVAMGAMETFAEVWPGAKKVVREVKTIARELLGLGQPALTERPPSVGTKEADTLLLGTNIESPVPAMQTFPGVEAYGYFDFPIANTAFETDLTGIDPYINLGLGFEVNGLS
ncbi:uncharacterized protein BDZ99DRAFT_556435 [Mytilinidion resinicola]|uniref:Zn(2)-C6 fungal-type domain-containing protein n=1 Tax=Mytilinidion resinicola TaxID=574789 RepID=A0A6A6YXH0_9PEZI|nr:uncharacterized protein BDZ99DRAFT_556435 [Mytilinidion resinicola]KAF2813113.1 hypothetical protein BDZ99DRAFT_556435 [Mytilinidion resinicola]